MLRDVDGDRIVHHQRGQQDERRQDPERDPQERDQGTSGDEPHGVHDVPLGFHDQGEEGDDGDGRPEGEAEEVRLAGPGGERYPEGRNVPRAVERVTSSDPAIPINRNHRIAAKPPWRRESQMMPRGAAMIRTMM